MIVHGFLSWIYVICFILTDKQHQTARKTLVFVVLTILLVHVLLLICFTAYHLLKT